MSHLATQLCPKALPFPPSFLALLPASGRALNTAGTFPPVPDLQDCQPLGATTTHIPLATCMTTHRAWAQVHGKAPVARSEQRPLQVSYPQNGPLPQLTRLPPSPSKLWTLQRLPTSTVELPGLTGWPSCIPPLLPTDPTPLRPCALVPPHLPAPPPTRDRTTITHGLPS